MANDWKNKDGSYVIQEQGDLGLGLTDIDKKYVDENGNIRIPKDDDKAEFKKSSNGFHNVDF